jgi:hypothetical protein
LSIRRRSFAKSISTRFFLFGNQIFLSKLETE